MSDKSEEDVRAISVLISALRPLDQAARVRVLDFVLKRFGISLSAETPNLHPPSPNPSVRSFAAEKKPKTVNEKVAVIGYYLAHLAPASERRDYLTSEIIETYFMQADLHLPAAPASVSLANAKNAGYLSVLERGRFKLTAVGYNLVAHKLPRGDTEERKRHTARKQSTSESRKMTQPADEALNENQTDHAPGGVTRTHDMVSMVEERTA